MKLRVVRKTYTSRSTIGELEVDGRFQCHTLEAVVRAEKIKGVTAIPAGTYPLRITHSARFQRELPLLEDVPNFEGIRIHPGNTPEDTAGCLLVGQTAATDFVGNSREAFARLFAVLSREISRGGEISIEIIDTGGFPALATAAATPAAGSLCRVTADPLRLRSSARAGASSKVIGRLPFGLVVTCTGRPAQAGWLEVEAMVDGQLKLGFAAAAFLEPLPCPATPGGAAAAAVAALYRVNGSSLHLRSQPAVLTAATVIATLPRHHLVRKLANAPEVLWWQVETVVHGKTLVGFVSSAWLEPAAWSPPSAGPPAGAASREVRLSERALQLILDFEGMDQPSRWPGQQSGISLGHGYDLGYHTYDELMGDWGPYLTPGQLARLAKAVGRRGDAAGSLAPAFSDIKITRTAADAVFVDRTVPRIKVQALTTFPGILSLPVDAQGALTSLVYNRGTDMQGDRRREMREIRDTVAEEAPGLAIKLTRIAASLRAMKRIWPGTERASGHPGIRRRREAEAALVEGSG